MIYGQEGITAAVEIVPATDMNGAIQRLGEGDVRYPFVLDLQGGLG